VTGEEAPVSVERWRRVVLVLLVGALVAAVVAVALLWSDRQDLTDRADEDSIAEVGAAAEDAARSAVTRMTTYDHRTVEADFAWVDEVGTEKFQAAFGDRRTASIEVIKGLRSSAVGTVIDSATTVEDADHVKVLLFVDQELRAQGQKPSKLEESRVTMQMVREGGRWLVDELLLQNFLTRE
jgi:Mce-associated membrane protein